MNRVTNKAQSKITNSPLWIEARNQYLISERNRSRLMGHNTPPLSPPMRVGLFYLKLAEVEKDSLLAEMEDSYQRGLTFLEKPELTSEYQYLTKSIIATSMSLVVFGM